MNKEIVELLEKISEKDLEGLSEPKRKLIFWLRGVQKNGKTKSKLVS